MTAEVIQQTPTITTALEVDSRPSQINQASEVDTPLSDYETLRHLTLLALARSSLPDSCAPCHESQLTYLNDFYWRLSMRGLKEILGIVEEKRGCTHDDKIEWPGVGLSQTI